MEARPTKERTQPLLWVLNYAQAVKHFSVLSFGPKNPGTQGPSDPGHGPRDQGSTPFAVADFRAGSIVPTCSGLSFSGRGLLSGGGLYRSSYGASMGLARLRPQEASGSLGPWVPGSMGSWVPGFLGSWVSGGMGVWVSGSLGPPASLRPWVSGCLGPRVFGSLGLWVPGSLGPCVPVFLGSWFPCRWVFESLGPLGLGPLGLGSLGLWVPWLLGPRPAPPLRP